MMKGFLFLFLFLTIHIEGHASSDEAKSLALNSKSIDTLENGPFQENAKILPHLFQKKRVRKVQPFKIKSNSSLYENDYIEKNYKATKTIVNPQG